MTTRISPHPDDWLDTPFGQAWWYFAFHYRQGICPACITASFITDPLDDSRFGCPACEFKMDYWQADKIVNVQVSPPEWCYGKFGSTNVQQGRIDPSDVAGLGLE